jgi:5-methylcytosine-specific restriction endonuclease McrA
MPINSAGFAFPKPGDRDQLLKLSPARYRRHKSEVWRKQGLGCGNCAMPLETAAIGHLHHTRKGGRGLGGSHRNDSETVLLCESCHRKEHQ